MEMFLFVSRSEVVALFEGLMEAECRKLKRLFPQCRIKRDNGEGEIFYKVSILDRRFKMYVGKSISFTIWTKDDHDECDDYTSDFTSVDFTEDEAEKFVDLLKTRYFPLLENPRLSSMDMFPGMWL